jgi:hypothetical protein
MTEESGQVVQIKDVEGLVVTHLIWGLNSGQFGKCTVSVVLPATPEDAPQLLVQLPKGLSLIGLVDLLGRKEVVIGDVSPLSVLDVVLIAQINPPVEGEENKQ